MLIESTNPVLISKTGGGSDWTVKANDIQSANAGTA